MELKNTIIKKHYISQYSVFICLCMGIKQVYESFKSKFT
jgi:hypothetical protein